MRGLGCALRSAVHKIAALPLVHVLLGLGSASAIEFAPSSDLSAHLCAREHQGRSGSCGGHAASVFTFVLCSIAGVSLGFAGPPSPRFTYAAARAIQQPGLGPLLDTGVQAVDPMRAVSEVGVIPMSAPTPDGRYSDIWTSADVAAFPDAPAANDGLRPSAVEDLIAAKHLVLGIYLIDPSQPTFIALVAAALSAPRPSPVALTIFVDTAFERWGEWVIDGVAVKTPPDANVPLDGVPDFNDKAGGGHFIVCVGHRTEKDGRLSFLLVNSWGGKDWGVAPPSLPFMAVTPEKGCIWVTETWLRASCGEAFAGNVTMKAAA